MLSDDVAISFQTEPDAPPVVPASTFYLDDGIDCRADDLLCSIFCGPSHRCRRIWRWACWERRMTPWTPWKRERLEQAARRRTSSSIGEVLLVYPQRTGVFFFCRDVALQLHFFKRWRVLLLVTRSKDFV